MSWSNEEIPVKQKLPEVSNTEEELLSLMGSIKKEKIPLKVAVYGDQGTRKTVTAMRLAQAASVPDDKILYIDSAENWSSMQNHPEVMRNVIRFPFKNVESLWTLAKAIQKGNPPFDRIGAVVFDEYSSIISYDTNWITEARSKQVEKEGGFKDPFKPEWPDYRAVEVRSYKTMMMFMHVTSRKLNLIYVAHENYYEKENMIRPNMPAATAKSFQGLLQGVYRSTLDHENKKDKSSPIVHRLQTMPLNRVSCKNRIGGVGLFTSVDELIKAYRVWGNVDIVNEVKETPKQEEPKEETSSLSPDDIDSLLK